MVVFEDSDAIPLRIPAEHAGGSVKLEFRWENGEIEHHWFWLPELPELERVSIAGREFISKRAPLPALRLGYHDIRAYWVKEPEQEAFESARFIVCPRRAREVEGRMAGVALSLYGLRSARNWGVGDFTDLRAVVDSLAPSGAAFIALNPLHAIPNRQPYNTSPYLPLCSLVSQLSLPGCGARARVLAGGCSAKGDRRVARNRPGGIRAGCGHQAAGAAPGVRAI